MNPPKENATDKLLTIGKALAGLAPGGGTLADLAMMFVQTPFQMKSQQWQEDVGDAIHRLASRGVDLTALQADPKFIDTIAAATAVAMRTSNEDKRAALRNAIINAGLPDAPDETKRMIFLDWIDRFTPLHLRILTLFNNPLAQFRGDDPRIVNRYSMSLMELLEWNMPEIVQQRDLAEVVWSYLGTVGAANATALAVMMRPGDALASRSTQLGRQFLAFVAEPPAPVKAD